MPAKPSHGGGPPPNPTRLLKQTYPFFSFLIFLARALDFHGSSAHFYQNGKTTAAIQSTPPNQSESQPRDKHKQNRHRHPQPKPAPHSSERTRKRESRNSDILPLTLEEERLSKYIVEKPTRPSTRKNAKPQSPNTSRAMYVERQKPT